jgi:hypothetical protein
MNKGIKGGLLAAAFAIGGIGAAQATPTINFDQGNGIAAAGTLTYDGAGGPAIGTGIAFDVISGRDTPQHSGAGDYLTCGTARCMLNFTTGDNTSAPSGSNGTWTFNGAGTFTLIGSVYTQSGALKASGTLLTGHFTDTQRATKVRNELDLSGFGLDTKNPDLLAYFGIGPNVKFSYVSTNISADITKTGDAFSGPITNADIDNTEVLPEPSGLLILGAGLLGLAFVVRRKSRTF